MENIYSKYQLVDIYIRCSIIDHKRQYYFNYVIMLILMEMLSKSMTTFQIVVNVDNNPYKK